MTANPVLLQKKYARVINLYAAEYGVSPETALGIFYNSLLYRLMREGVSDLHCMSDEYLAESLHDEILAQNTQV